MVFRIALLCCGIVFTGVAHADKLIVGRSLGGPVVLTIPYRHEMIGTGLDVRNRSDKKVSKITIEVRQSNPDEPDSISVEELPVEFAPGEGGRLRIPYRERPGSSSETTFTVIGVEYADGSHWTLPKT